MIVINDALPTLWLLGAELSELSEHLAVARRVCNYRAAICTPGDGGDGDGK